MAKSGSAPDFGWELLLSTLPKEANHDNDILVAFAHWRMQIRGLRAVGKGEHFTGDTCNGIDKIQYLFYVYSPTAVKDENVGSKILGLWS